MTLKYDKLSSEPLNKHSFLAVFTIGILLGSSVTASNLAFSDVIAPNKQLDLDFTPQEVICKEKLVKIIRTSNDEVACVSPETVTLLVDRGFALAPNPEIISEVIEQQSTPIGKITHMATTKHYKNPGEVESFPKVNAHNYVFSVRI